MDFLRATAELASQLTLIGGAIGAVGGIIWAAVNKPWKRVSRAMLQVDEMSTALGPNHGKLLVSQVDMMAKALGPNGGKSLADEIRRQGEEQVKQSAALTKTAVAVDALCDVIEKSIFQTDARGHWIRVNRTFSHIFGYPTTDVIGMGWVSCIHPDDRDAFLQEWNFAIQDRRPFRRPVRLITRTESIYPVIVHASPALGNPDIHLGWFGTVELTTAKIGRS